MRYIELPALEQTSRSVVAILDTVVDCNGGHSNGTAKLNKHEASFWVGSRIIGLSCSVPVAGK